jgi:hypothetical protein
MFAVVIFLAIFGSLVWRSEREIDPARATASFGQRRAWRRERLDLNTAHRGRWVP